MKRYTLIILLLSVFIITPAQTKKNRVPNLQTSWIGNSFGGGLKWVQINMEQMNVSPDGTIHTWSSWDEGGRRYGVYKGVQREDGKWSGDVIGNDNVTFNGGQAIVGKTQWYIEGYVNLNGYDKGRTQRSGTKVICKAKNITLNFTKATSLGVDYKNNYLMVTDDGPLKHLVMFYDTLGNFVKQLGVPGGIWPSSVGGNKALDGVIDNDLKFYFLSGCGADSTGKIYIGMTDIYQMIGSWVRCFNPKGDSLLWEIHSHYFTDASDFDHLKDGKEIYSTMRHYKIDYTKEPGNQYTLTGITLNPNKYPSDPRTNGTLKVPLVRYIKGKKFLFYTGMSTNSYQIFKFDSLNFGETAIPTGISLTPSNYQSSAILDSVGNFWYTTDNNINELPLGNSLDGNSNPVYGAVKTFPKPALFANVKSCWYAGGPNDVMYVGGFKPGDDDITGWFEVGRVLARYDHWNTSPVLVWENDSLPFFHHNTLPVGGRIVNKTIFTAGDYVFVDYVTYNNANPDPTAPGPINVYNISNGKFVGEIFAGSEVFQQSSWHDVTVAYNVMQRSNKEYVIVGEENWKAKNLLYRWCPTGDCDNFTYPTVSVNTTKKYAIKEGQVAAEMSFVRQGVKTSPLTVNYTLSGTANAADFTTSLNGSITFDAGKDTVKLSLVPSLSGNNENKKLVLSLSKSDTYWVSKDISVASIFLFGHPKTQVKIKTTATTIHKDGSDSTAIILTRDTNTGNLPLNLIINGTALSNTDYYPVKSSRVIPDGMLADTFYLRSKNDIVLKDNKSLILTIPNDTDYLVQDSSFVTITILGDKPSNTDSTGTISCYNFHGNVTIDGDFNEPFWQFKNELTKATDGWKRNTAYFALAWDTTYLYLGVNVKDANVVTNNAASPWENDAIEIYIDGDNHKGNSLNSFDEQYISVAGDAYPLWSAEKKTANVRRKGKLIDGGYTLEMAIPWYLYSVTLKEKLKIGFDISCDDNNGSGRDNSFVWNGNGDDFQSVAKYGTIILNDTIGWKLGAPAMPEALLPVVSLNVTSPSTAEDGTKAATIVVSRTKTNGDLPVKYSVSGSASPADYKETLSGTIVIPDGAASAILTITAVADALTEGSESVAIGIQTSSSYDIGTPSQALIYINDHENDTTQAKVPLEGLKVWLKGDAAVISNAGKVSMWGDNAGNDNNATQNAAGAQPKIINSIANGYPALYFDGTSALMNFNFKVSGLKHLSLFTVTSDNSGQLNLWGEHAPLLWDQEGGWGSVFLAADRTKAAWRFGTGESDNANAKTYTDPLDTGKFVIASAVMNNNDDNLYINGLPAGTKTRTKDSISNTSSICMLGGGANSTKYKGYIAEVLVYDISLDNAARSQVEKYLTDKYLVKHNGQSVQEMSHPEISLSPNPLVGNSLSLSNLNGPASIYIYDLQGRQVGSYFAVASGHLQLNNIELKAGLYLVSIHLNNQIITKKLIVK